MQRQSFYLPKNQKTEVPLRWLFIDTETKDLEHSDGTTIKQLNFGWALHWVREHNHHPEQLRWHRFTTQQEALDLIWWLMPEKTRLILCCHNLSFDAGVLNLLPNLEALGWRIPWYCPEYGARIYHCTNDSRTLQCVDSTNWYPHSIQELGEHLDLPKLPMPGEDGSVEQWDAYCKRDVEVMYLSVRQWIDRVRGDDLGNFRTTLAGQALSAYRHRFCPERIVVDKRETVTAISRESYYGGRTEAYRIGVLPNQRYTMLDVNSCYPYMMHEYTYPVRCVNYSEAFPADRCPRFEDPCTVIADVELETPEPWFPKRRQRTLLFPTGRYRTTLAGPELALAVQSGYVKRVYCAARFDLKPLFRGYVDHFFASRIACQDVGDAIGALINKNLLNTLQGKFAQWSPVWKEVESYGEAPYQSWSEYDGEHHKWVHYRTHGSAVYEHSESDESHLSIPSITAYVTSYARVYLLSLITRAGWKHVYYVDTDCLLVDNEGLEALSDLMHSRDLGKLKVVWQEEDVEIAGLKSYRYGDRWVCAGLRPDAELLPDGSWSTTIHWGIEHQWSEREGRGVVEQRIIKRLQYAYHKGIVGDDGRVSPLVLEGSP